MAYDPNYYQQQQQPYVSYSSERQRQYAPGDYTPHGDLPLTQSRHSPQPAYPTTQSLTPYHPPPSPGYSPSSRYLSASDDRSHRRHRSRSRSRHHHHSRSRSRSRSRTGEIGSTLLGAAGGGFLAHKYGGGSTLSTIGGAVAGAVGGRFAEKEWEKQKEKRERRIERGEEVEADKVLDGFLHPRRAISRARSKVREGLEGSDGSSSGEEDRRERRRRHRRHGDGRARSEGRYYEEEWEVRRGR